MFTPLPNGIKVTFVFSIGGKEVTISIYVTTPSGVDLTDLENAVAIGESWWNDQLRGLVATGVTLLAIRALDVSVENGQQVVNNNIETPAGLVAGDAMPNNVALVFSLRTGFVGRSFRGRFYIPGLAESAVSGNNIVSGTLTYAQQVGTALVTLFAAGGLTVVVASYVANGVQRTTAVATPVQTVLINTRVDTQRRRLPRN